jgi:hypothetical protein
MGDSDKAGLRQLMPSLFNGIATAIAAAAGLIGLLHQTGYLGNHPHLRAGIEARSRDENTVAAEQAREIASAEAPAAPAAPAAIPEAPADTAPIHRNLSGAWRDMGSNCHVIKQTGHELTVNSYYADTGKGWLVGNGTIKGRVVSLKINSDNPKSLVADMILSDDGRELSGMIKGVKGAHVARWRFLGPSCS